VTQDYIVGVDLGTTNTVVAYTEAGGEDIRLFDIGQLVRLGEFAPRPLLPSVRYHPAAGELNDADIRLPWPDPDVAGLGRVIIGRLARELEAQVPGRAVASAKSWLSHPSVDRTAPILPWGAPDDVAKVSPVAASASYLGYVRAAWNWRFPEAPLERQDVVLTVPASFDEGARALTVQAARMAGLDQVRLQEEPQAVFYDWLFRHRGSLHAELRHTRLVLVCDVGGGTTDLTLIRVEFAGRQPRLTRIGVGDHLMLGGDNMDLALAHLAEARMAAGGSRLSAGRLSQLIQQCRSAKERLLAPEAPERAAVTVLGAGARLVGGARSVDLARDEVQAMLLDGFFPKVAPDERPKRVRSGLVEFGLPYVADPAITRHVAAFLAQHETASRQALGTHGGGDQALAMPDTLLLNGGVFRAETMVRRLEDTLASWREAPLKVLHNDNPDLAVARGAVAYALARRGLAPRIGGGSARSFFLVLEEERGRPHRGICVLPRGTEEGRDIRLAGHTFALRLGKPVRFHLVSSRADTPYPAGALTDTGTDEFVHLPPFATVVPPQGNAVREVAVQLSTSLTEVGTLEMHCVSSEDSAKRWRLEFQLRGAGGAVPAGSRASVHQSFGEAVDKIERVFGSKSGQIGGKEVKQLHADLEQILGRREGWAMPLLRELFDTLWERARRRRRSANHERLWLNLTGYCLRPGFGYPLDDWRIDELWTLHGQGIQYVKESRVWSEWWTLWRRVAGGLDERAQLSLLDDITPDLRPEGKARGKGPAGGHNPGHDDMVQLAASLERLPVERKVEVVEWLLERLRKPAENLQTWRAVGRIGARTPFYGSAHNVVPPEVAGQWLERILALDWEKVGPAAFAAVLVARLTGDRARDLPDAMRGRVIARLQAQKTSRNWVAMLSEVIELDDADEQRVFGDSLPPGLKLIPG
jgi:molecular chaperone DnaK (HSP70)